MNDQIYRELDNINGETARITTDKLLEIERILSNGSRPDPYPGNPPPPPPNGGSYYVSMISEGKSFSVNVSNTSEAFDACLSQFSSLAKADDISVSINYGQKNSRTTSGWWYGVGGICAQAVSLLTQLNLPQQSSYLHVGGAISGVSFSLKGYSFGELAARCESFIRERGITKSDSVVTTNMREIKTPTTSGWWYTPVEICQQALSVLR